MWESKILLLIKKGMIFILVEKNAAINPKSEGVENRNTPKDGN